MLTSYQITSSSPSSIHPTQFTNFLSPVFKNSLTRFLLGVDIHQLTPHFQGSLFLLQVVGTKESSPCCVEICLCVPSRMLVLAIQNTLTPFSTSRLGSCYLLLSTPCSVRHSSSNVISSCHAGFS